MYATRNVLALTALLTLSGAGTASAADKPELQQLRTVEQLADAFNRDAGAPRVVLLLSPT